MSTATNSDTESDDTEAAAALAHQVAEAQAEAARYATEMAPLSGQIDALAEQLEPFTEAIRRAHGDVAEMASLGVAAAQSAAEQRLTALMAERDRLAAQHVELAARLAALQAAAWAARLRTEELRATPTRIERERSIEITSTSLAVARAAVAEASAAVEAATTAAIPILLHERDLRYLEKSGLVPPDHAGLLDAVAAAHAALGTVKAARVALEQAGNRERICTDNLAVSHNSLRDHRRSVWIAAAHPDLQAVLAHADAEGARLERQHLDPRTHVAREEGWRVDAVRQEARARLHAAQAQVPQGYLAGEGA